MRFFYFLLIAFVISSCTTNVKSSVTPPINNRSVHFETGVVTAQFDQSLSVKLKKSEIKVSYYPVEDLVCLRFRNGIITSYQFWYLTDRQTFLSALEHYKIDYELQNLPKKRNSTKEYNYVEIYHTWETASFSTKGMSFPKINIGYIIKGNFPYFTLHQLNADNLNESTKRQKAENMRLTIYFTRSQADSLAALFDQDYLRSLNVPAKLIEEEPDVD